MTKRLKCLEVENTVVEKMHAEVRLKAEIDRWPIQNAYIERFNPTLRDERLDLRFFELVEHAQSLATECL
jgi:hypothetical protein